MKIGIISDTHIKGNNEKLDDFKNLLYKNLRDVDVIIHAGDYNTLETLNTIKEFKEFYGVYGNNDDDYIKNILRESKVVSLNGYKIGITHGDGKYKTTIDRAYDKFKDSDVDIIIFGHSHMPLIKTKYNILFLNPGSLTSKRKEKYFSYIILEINEACISTNLRLFN